MTADELEHQRVANVSEQSRQDVGRCSELDKDSARELDVHVKLSLATTRQWRYERTRIGAGQTSDNRGSEELAMGAVERAHRNLRPSTQGAPAKEKQGGCGQQESEQSAAGKHLGDEAAWLGEAPERGDRAMGERQGTPSRWERGHQGAR
jgi:hypothetical protein